MKGKINFVLILFIVVLASCKQEQYYLFNDVARIQFGPATDKIYTASSNFVDTTKNYTFYYEDAAVKQDTVFFDIYTIGGVTSYDRPFTLEQVQMTNGSANAVAGTDYKSFSDPSVAGSYVIKAGQVHTSVPIVLLRAPAQKTTTYTLFFKVVENEHFKLGEIRNLWRKVIFTDRLSQPTAWNSSFTQYYCGAYSVVKHAFMIKTTGEKWDQEFMSTVTSDYALLKFYLAKCKVALSDYNAAHPGNPMKDENGLVILFP